MQDCNYMTQKSTFEMFTKLPQMCLGMHITSCSLDLKLSVKRKFNARTSFKGFIQNHSFPS